MCDLVQKEEETLNLFDVFAPRVTIFQDVLLMILQRQLHHVGRYTEGGTNTTVVQDKESDQTYISGIFSKNICT